MGAPPGVVLGAVASHSQRRAGKMEELVMEVAGLLGGGGVPLAMLVGLAVTLVVSAFQLARIRSR